MWKMVVVSLVILAGSVAAQTHQHGTTPEGDGEFNPFPPTRLSAES